MLSTKARTIRANLPGTDQPDTDLTITPRGRAKPKRGKPGCYSMISVRAGPKTTR